MGYSKARKAQMTTAVRLVLQAIGRPATANEIAAHHTMKDTTPRMVGQFLRHMGAKRLKGNRWSLRGTHTAVVRVNNGVTHLPPKQDTGVASIPKNVFIGYSMKPNDVFFVVGNARFPFRVLDIE